MLQDVTTRQDLLVELEPIYEYLRGIMARVEGIENFVGIKPKPAEKQSPETKQEKQPPKK